MSATAPRRVAAPLDQGPSQMTRVAAVVVVLALAWLAYYAVFSGPTTIAVNAPAKASPAKGAAPADEPSAEGNESGRGD